MIYKVKFGGSDEQIEAPSGVKLICFLPKMHRLRGYRQRYPWHASQTLVILSIPLYACDLPMTYCSLDRLQIARKASNQQPQSLDLEVLDLISDGDDHKKESHLEKGFPAEY